MSDSSVEVALARILTLFFLVLILSLGYFFYKGTYTGECKEQDYIEKEVFISSAGGTVVVRKKQCMLYEKKGK